MSINTLGLRTIFAGEDVGATKVASEVANHMKTAVGQMKDQFQSLMDVQGDNEASFESLRATILSAAKDTKGYAGIFDKAVYEMADAGMTLEDAAQAFMAFREALDFKEAARMAKDAAKIMYAFNMTAEDLAETWRSLRQFGFEEGQVKPFLATIVAIGKEAGVADKALQGLPAVITEMNSKMSNFLRTSSKEKIEKTIQATIMLGSVLKETGGGGTRSFEIATQALSKLMEQREELISLWTGFGTEIPEEMKTLSWFTGIQRAMAVSLTDPMSAIAELAKVAEAIPKDNVRIYTRYQRFLTDLFGPEMANMILRNYNVILDRSKNFNDLIADNGEALDKVTKAKYWTIEAATKRLEAARTKFANVLRGIAEKDVIKIKERSIAALEKWGVIMKKWVEKGGVLGYIAKLFSIYKATDIGTVFITVVDDIITKINEIFSKKREEGGVFDFIMSLVSGMGPIELIGFGAALLVVYEVFSKFLSLPFGLIGGPFKLFNNLIGGRMVRGIDRIGRGLGRIFKGIPYVGGLIESVFGGFFGLFSLFTGGALGGFGILGRIAELFIAIGLAMAGVSAAGITLKGNWKNVFDLFVSYRQDIIKFKELINGIFDLSGLENIYDQISKWWSGSKGVASWFASDEFKSAKETFVKFCKEFTKWLWEDLMIPIWKDHLKNPMEAMANAMIDYFPTLDEWTNKFFSKMGEIDFAKYSKMITVGAYSTFSEEIDKDISTMFNLSKESNPLVRLVVKTVTFFMKIILQIMVLSLDIMWETIKGFAGSFSLSTGKVAKIGKIGGLLEEEKIEIEKGLKKKLSEKEWKIELSLEHGDIVKGIDINNLLSERIKRYGTTDVAVIKDLINQANKVVLKYNQSMISTVGALKKLESDYPYQYEKIFSLAEKKLELQSGSIKDVMEAYEKGIHPLAEENESREITLDVKFKDYFDENKILLQGVVDKLGEINENIISQTEEGKKKKPVITSSVNIDSKRAQKTNEKNQSGQNSLIVNCSMG